MRVTVNGEERSFEGVGDVTGLLTALALDPRKVAVELNLEIVPRSAYDGAPVRDGDRLEIVQFVGGG